ncbi:MAG: sensor histidine kinase, partial [Acidimicrobiia bacterium]
LDASRARLVTEADEARRRLVRDLHDGAQQRLVHTIVTLKLAQRALRDDDGTAQSLVDEALDHAEQGQVELRELAHGIYPPLLVDAGLGPALRAAGDRSPLAVDVFAEGTGRYPGDVEAAVYFCCLEALQNAAKHAAGAQVTIRLFEEAGGLRFEVTDDGPGFDAGVAGRGQGFTNMADRLGAIGGSVQWTSQPGQGARVAGALPLAGMEG